MLAPKTIAYAAKAFSPTKPLYCPTEISEAITSERPGLKYCEIKIIIFGATTANKMVHAKITHTILPKIKNVFKFFLLHSTKNKKKEAIKIREYSKDVFAEYDKKALTIR